MKPESVSPTLDQEISASPSTQLAPEATGAPVTQENNESTPRCAFRYANRHRCRLAITPLSAPFCDQHCSFRPDDPDTVNLAPALLGDLTELITAVDMQNTLSKLFILLAQNRVTTKKASVLSYIVQQLLRTLSAIDRETRGDDDHVTIIMDGPRPVRD